MRIKITHQCWIQVEDDLDLKLFEQQLKNGEISFDDLSYECGNEVWLIEKDV